MAFPVLSTYRLQLRGAASGFGFTFADAENLLDYLDDLGVSHLYLSPILTPVTGSGHGYDVTDPTTVSAELGGAEGLARLSAAARARGMGLIVDIVPNHVGVDQPEQNPWWWDVLRHGRSSAYASFFDIDWELGDGRVVLPVLGSDDDVADLTVDGDVLRLGDLAFPIAPGTDDGTGPQVHDRQHYQLVGWRRGVVGYRRFFSITSLAGLRQEDNAVFDASHVEVGRWFAEGLVDGVRIDHPDGLFDPAGYLTWLRELAGPEAWIVIEKILAVDEALEPTLPVAGTTGYDSLREVGGLFVDPTGAEALTALYESTGIDYSATPAVLRDLKAAVATDTLGSELARLCRAIVTAAGADHPQLPDAVAALLGHIDVYRFDYQGLAATLSTALAETESAAPQLQPTTADRGCGLRTRRRTRCPTAAVVRRGHREVGRGLPVLSRRSPGLAQRSRRRAGPVWCRRGGIPRQCRHPGAVMAARDDDADDPRHQARRRRPGSHRGAVAGAVAVGRVRRPLGDDRSLPRPRHRIVSVAEHLRGLAGERRGHRRTTGSAARLCREVDPGSGIAHHLERSRHRLRRRRARLGGLRPRRTGCRTAHRTRHPAQHPRRERRAGSEAAGADGARYPRRVPGHRAVGRQSGRPRQPSRRGLRHPTRSIEVSAAPENSDRQSGPADAARPAGHLPAGRLPSGARRRSRCRPRGGVPSQ